MSLGRVGNLFLSLTRASSIWDRKQNDWIRKKEERIKGKSWVVAGYATDERKLWALPLGRLWIASSAKRRPNPILICFLFFSFFIFQGTKAFLSFYFFFFILAKININSNFFYNFWIFSFFCLKVIYFVILTKIQNK